MNSKQRRLLHVVGCLCLSLFGCSTFMGPSPLTMELDPLPLSENLDAQIAVADLEQAFLHTFHNPPIIFEGEQNDEKSMDVVSSTMPIDRRQSQLKRLGSVEKTIPSCKRGLAHLSHAEVTVPDQPWLDIFTACVQITSNEQRIILGVGAIGAPSMEAHAAPEHRDARLNKLNQLRKAFLTLHAPSTRTTESQITPPVKKQSSIDLHVGQSSPVHVVPLLCLEPKAETVPIFAIPEIGTVIGTVEAGHMVVGQESDGLLFFRVTMEEGVSGWVKRAQMRRSACPIG
jgi:hypothetical protein